MLKDLKEDMLEIKKMMCKQNENINTEKKTKKKPKMNSGAENYRNCSEKFTEGFKGRSEQAEKRTSEPWPVWAVG